MKKKFVCVHTPCRTFQARTLFASVTKWLPEREFVGVQVDKVGKYADTFLHVACARVESTLEMFEAGAPEVIQCGVDYLVCSDFWEIDEVLKHPEALFVPHVVEVLPPEIPWLRNLLHGGVINSDFQVWRNTPAVRDFLKEMLKQISSPKFKVTSPFEIEQWWLQCALSMLDSPALIRNPGYGVAFYNLHERWLEKDPDSEPYYVKTAGKMGSGSGRRLSTFHFSGMKFDDKASLLTVYGEPFGRKLNAAEVEFIKDYRRQCGENTA